MLKGHLVGQTVLWQGGIECKQGCKEGNVL